MTHLAVVEAWRGFFEIRSEWDGEEQQEETMKTTGATILSCCSATDPLDTYNQCFHTPYIRTTIFDAEEHNHLSIEVLYACTYYLSGLPLTIQPASV